MPNNDLIPAPRKRPQRVYVGDGNKSSLQEQMGMAACTDILSEILTCIAHGVDLDEAYRRQNPAILRAVTQEVLSKLPVLREYEDAWPVEYYFARELKSHVHRPKQKVGQHTRRRRSQTPLISRIYGRWSVPATRTVGTQHSAIFVRRPNKRVVSHRASRRNSPSISSQIQEKNKIGTQLRGNGPVPHLVTPPPSIEPSPSSSSEPVFKLLVSARFPRPDAQHLAKLLASKGIKDLSYLKVFARMSTRDGWLAELVREGAITEIQMRVLREILESRK
ncbi:hypothetical protein L226DRAFT_611677 [Lentinus tigrinus ALCF2SS1-7]|uniref:uncharacterized protein n=1 Tax=Lentinus tigrinus ALCF2SS1-7 TaxID=1328758 RepID=UPI001165E2D9|nr:hypothetical protein L226DRAFT_611677 [Lentinus tigrinus ALCF2SS1-7]